MLGQVAMVLATLLLLTASQPVFAGSPQGQTTVKKLVDTVEVKGFRITIEEGEQLGPGRLLKLLVFNTTCGPQEYRSASRLKTARESRTAFHRRQAVGVPRWSKD